MKMIIRAILVFLVLLSVGCTSDAGHGAHKSGVIFLMLDTLRADHLGVYGYSRDTSPNLDAFASENLRAAYNVTPAPWTPPSVASMFTGVYPVTHGVMPPNDRKLAKQKFMRIPDSFETLAERYKANGYKTGAVTPNPWTTEQFGYAQGFDQFHFRERARAEEINRAALKMLDGWGPNPGAFFMYVHYLDPHDPYDPPGEFRNSFSGPAPGGVYNEKMTEHINLYDGEIKYLDHHLGELFKALKSRGIYDSTTILIVADHGEQFLEHGHVRHGNQLHNEELHVPLLLKAPGARGVLEETTSSVDIYPTLMAVSGIAVPTGMPGVSILDRQKLTDRPGVISEIAKVHAYRSIVSSSGVKLIVDVAPEVIASTPAGKPLGLYDRRVNYSEQTSLPFSEVSEALLKRLEVEYAAASRAQPSAEVPGVEVKDETIEQLQSLGYLN